MENNWKDTTTYSRDDKVRKPSQWTLDTGKLKITVLNAHIYYPNRWVLICYEIGVKCSILKAPIETPLEHIQAAGIRIVRKKVEELLNSLPS